MIDSDLIPETNVLKNKLGITDQTLLDQAEADITYLKLLDIDAFFEGVMVMAEDTELKANRLRLLSKLRSLFMRVADISVLQH